MLGLIGGSGVCLVLQPVDFRRGIAALSVYAREHLGLEPCSEVVLVFRSRRPDRMKVLHHDGSGMVLVSKRQDRGRFRWPPISEGVLRLSRAELSVLSNVCDWRGVTPSRRPSPGV